MITYEEAISANHFEHVTLKNKDGTALRARRNGKTQTWVTRKGEFRIPCKYGLKQCFNITDEEAHNWRVA